LFSIVTLVHNQSKNLPEVLLAYSSQSLQPTSYIFVLDRCTDDSEEIIIEFSKTNNVIIIKNNNGLDFQAGYCRDLGLDSVDSDVLFLDGDCVPSKNLFEEISNELLSNEPTIAIAKRINMISDGTGSSPDTRESTPWFIGLIINENKTIIKNKELARARMITWSCCLGLNKLAIAEIKKVNIDIFGENRLFPSLFDGRWGGEDDHIGHVSMFLE
jgi:glycosyltransferase involved in cell wall biosynthesis